VIERQAARHCADRSWFQHGVGIQQQQVHSARHGFGDSPVHGAHETDILGIVFYPARERAGCLRHDGVQGVA
jgi:hypothetical protein